MKVDPEEIYRLKRERRKFAKMLIDYFTSRLESCTDPINLLAHCSWDQVGQVCWAYDVLVEEDKE